MPAESDTFELDIISVFFFACSNFFQIEILEHDAFKDKLLVQIWVHLPLINWLCVCVFFLSILFVLSLSYWFPWIMFILGCIVLCQGRLGVILGRGQHYIAYLRAMKDWAITEGLRLWWSFHTDYKWGQINRSLPEPLFNCVRDWKSLTIHLWSLPLASGTLAFSTLWVWGGKNYAFYTSTYIIFVDINFLWKFSQSFVVGTSFSSSV